MHLHEICTYFSVEVQFGQSQATRLTLRPVGVDVSVEVLVLDGVAVGAVPAELEGGPVVTAGVGWTGLLTSCHLVGSFGSC